MTDLQMQVIGAALESPESLLKFRNRTYILKILSKILCRRVGVENETAGLQVSPKDEVPKFEEITRSHYVCSDYPRYNAMCEIRITGAGNHTKPLDFIKLLYKLCEYLKENYCINDKGAIHIHVDLLNDVDYTNKKQYEKLREILMMNRKFFEQEVANYEGRYNPKVVTHGKSGTISFRCGDMNTIEFRMFKCTFDYKTILKHIICCTYLVEQAAKGQKIDRTFVRSVMAL